MEGFLYKRGRRTKVWVRRYFEMQGQNLTYFKNDEALTSAGTIGLQGRVLAQPGPDPLVFTLSSNDVEREYELRAPDAGDLEGWLSALGRVVQNSSGGLVSGTTIKPPVYQRER